MSTTTPIHALESFFSSLHSPATRTVIPTPADEPAWEGMPADEAFLLIEEIAQSRNDIGRLMECWRLANTHVEALAA